MKVLLSFIVVIVSEVLIDFISKQLGKNQIIKQEIFIIPAFVVLSAFILVIKYYIKDRYTIQIIENGKVVKTTYPKRLIRNILIILLNIQILGFVILWMHGMFLDQILLNETIVILRLIMGFAFINIISAMFRDPSKS